MHPLDNGHPVLNRIPKPVAARAFERLLLNCKKEFYNRQYIEFGKSPADNHVKRIFSGGYRFDMIPAHRHAHVSFSKSPFQTALFYGLCGDRSFPAGDFNRRIAKRMPASGREEDSSIELEEPNPQAALPGHYRTW